MEKGERKTKYFKPIYRFNGFIKLIRERIVLEADKDHIVVLICPINFRFKFINFTMP